MRDTGHGEMPYISRQQIFPGIHWQNQEDMAWYKSKRMYGQNSLIKPKVNVMRGPQRYYGKSCQQCVELLQFNPRTLLIVNSVKKEGCHVVVSPKMCRPNDYMEYVNLVQSNIKLMAN